MRNKAIVFLALILSSASTFAQGECLTGGCSVSSSQYPPTLQTNPTSTFSPISNMFAGEFALCEVTTGITYEWSLCSADGATVSFTDSELTLFNASNNTVLCYSDDYCGLHAKIQWTATFTGNVKIQVNEYSTFACSSNSSSTNLMWRAYSSATNDAAVTNIYTYGKLTPGFNSPHQIQARISNQGTGALSSLVVTLNVSGANTFTTTQTIPSLASLASTTVTFPGFNPVNTGTNIITVSVPNDAVLGNNTQTMTQLVNTNNITHAYGTTMDGGAGFTNASGDIVAKFDIAAPLSIASINVNFFDGGNPFVVKIYNMSGNLPGTVVYTSNSQTSVQGVNSVNISPPFSVTGPFFVGVEQTGTTNFSLAFQYETPIRDATFYYKATGTSTWTNFSPSLTFRQMIEVIAACTVPAQPAAISGTSAVCPGMSQIYTVPTVAGATSYTWTLPSGWTGTSTSNSITTTVGSSGGTVSVVAVNNCGNSAASNLPVTIATMPVASAAINGNTTICSGFTQTYSASPVSGATSYTWTLPPGWSGSSTGASINVTAGNSAGTISVVANNSCGSGPATTLAIAVSPSAVIQGPIVGSPSLCANATETYSIPPVSGATNYTWYLPSGWSGSSTTNSIVATAGTTGGTIFVSATNSCGTSPAENMNVAVNNAIPAQPGAITGSSSVCAFSNQSFSVAPVANATSYNWTFPSGWTSTGNTNNVTVTAGTTAGTITVTAENGCGVSSAQSFTVGVVPAPAQPGPITGPGTTCPGLNNTYSISPVTGAISYNWSLPSGWTGTSTTTSINVVAGAASGMLSVTAFDGTCNSVPQGNQITVGSLPDQPSAITGTNAICANESTTFTVPPVTGANSYLWTLPNGWNGVSTTNSITVVTGYASGQVLVSAVNNCGPGTAESLQVTINPTPQIPTAIAGNANACAATSQTYSVTSDPAATYYNWVLPSGWTGSSTTNSITVTTTANSGQVLVSAHNTNCSSAQQNLAVNVQDVPSQPSAISGMAAVCATAQETYGVDPVSGSTNYSWLLPAGWAGSSTTNSIVATAGTSGGDIIVSASNACGSSPIRMKSVSSLPTPSVPVITFDGSNFSSSAATGNQWYLNGNAITGATAQTQVPLVNGIYTVVVTGSNGCTSSSQDFNFTELSVLKNSLDPSIIISPNPSKGMVRVSLTDLLPHGNVTVSNLIGKTVMEILPEKFNNPNHEYSFDGKILGAGVYFITIHSAGKVSTKKFVVH